MYSLNFNNYQLSNHCKLDPSIYDISDSEVPQELDPAVLSIRRGIPIHDYIGVASNMAIHTLQPEYTTVA
jgi:hypothetical protein